MRAQAGFPLAAAGVAVRPTCSYRGAMPRESQAQRRRRALRLLDRLEEAMPEATIELDHRTPLELLVAVLLSAQTTDKRVNLVTPALFARFRSAGDYAAAQPEDLEPFIKTVGLFRTKSKALAALGRALVAEHGGGVPLERAALARLPGVGQKTAGVVSMHLGGDAAFPVDTHVARLSRRMGFTTAAGADRIEQDLQALFPRERWFQGHQLLVWHGRRVCVARSPRCEGCVVTELCPKRGL
jgi:endonuclease-3